MLLGKQTTYITPKQLRIIKLWRSDPTQGISIDDLIALEGTSKSKQAMQHTIRQLDELGLAERRYVRKDRVTLVVHLTERGKQCLTTSA